MEVTGTTVGKGVAVIGGGSASGYEMYALTSGTGESMEFEEAQTGSLPELLAESWPDFLFQVKDFGTESSEYGPNTFGYAFGRFMLNPDGDSLLWDKKEKSLEEIDIDSLSDEFKVLKNDEEKNLQQICKEIHRKQKKDVRNLNNVWGFCSVGLYTPYTVNSVQASKSKYVSKWAGVSKNADALFDTVGSTNDEDLWNHVYENILKVDLQSETEQALISNKFSSISSWNGLSKICEESYDTKPTDNMSNYGNNVRKYCLLDASIELSQYPTEPGN